MGAEFEIGFTVFDDDLTYLQGISDLVVLDIAGEAYLIAASEADDAVTVFHIGAGTPPTIVSTITYTPASGTLVASGLALFDSVTSPLLLTLGRYDDNFGVYQIETDGSLVQTTLEPAVAVETSRGWVADFAQAKKRSVMYTASFDGTTINAFDVDDDGQLTFWREFRGFNEYRLFSISTLKVVTLNGQQYLAVANMHVDSVVLFRVEYNGWLIYTDVFSDADQGGISAVTAFGDAQVEARGFLLVANAMAHSISVLRVSENGTFNLVDTFYDTRDTRFGGVVAMEVVEHDGRIFVFAGGADDGITVLELDYRGQLRHLATIADDFDIALQNVSSITVRMVGDVAHVYVGSQTDHGITELIIDLSRSGQDIRGGSGNDVLTGTDGDDIIWGMGHKDTLYGGDGDDRLIDGRGRDVLYGGAGADTFVFIEDGRSDFIEDFEIGIDRIDLSDWDHLYHISSLDIGTRAGGAVIFVGDDIIRITSVDGQPIDASLFTQDTFIFG